MKYLLCLFYLFPGMDFPALHLLRLLTDTVDKASTPHLPIKHVTKFFVIVTTNGYNIMWVPGVDTNVVSYRICPNIIFYFIVLSLTAQRKNPDIPVHLLATP